MTEIIPEITVCDNIFNVVHARALGVNDGVGREFDGTVTVVVYGRERMRVGSSRANGDGVDTGVGAGCGPSVDGVGAVVDYVTIDVCGDDVGKHRCESERDCYCELRNWVQNGDEETYR